MSFLRNSKEVALRVVDDCGKTVPLYQTQDNTVSINGRYYNHYTITHHILNRLTTLFKETGKKITQAILFISRDHPHKDIDIHAELRVIFATDHKCSRDTVVFEANLSEFFDVDKYVLDSDGELITALKMERFKTFQVYQPHVAGDITCSMECSSAIPSYILGDWLKQKDKIFSFLIRHNRNGQHKVE